MADMTVLPKPQVVAVNTTGRLVERRACCYCWATFTVKRAGATCCSPECSQRVSAWDQWVAVTREFAVTGDVCKPINLGPRLPAGGQSLLLGVRSGAVQLELLEAVA